MSISVSLLNFPEETIRNYVNLLMLILAAVTGLIGWNRFFPCIISGMLYFGFFISALIPMVFASDSCWYMLLMLLPAIITIAHAFYAKFRNRKPDQ